MDAVSIGLWGAYSAIALLLFSVALYFYKHNWLRSALYSACVTLVVTLYLYIHIGWVPLPLTGLAQRLPAINTLIAASVLTWVFLLTTRRGRPRLTVASLLLGLFATSVTISLWLPPERGLALALGVSLLLSSVCLVLAALDLRLRKTSAFFTFLAVAANPPGILTSVLISQGDQPWPVHMVTVVCGIVCIGSVAMIFWQRFYYLVELSDALRWGAQYDPISRSTSLANLLETQRPVRDLLLRKPPMLGVVNVYFANITQLEQDHGRDVANLARYVLTARMRRAASNTALFAHCCDSTYALLVQNVDSVRQLIGLARSVRQQLERPIRLVSLDSSPSKSLSTLHASLPANWVAQFGIGLHVQPLADLQTPEALKQMHDIAVAGLGVPDQVAWYDDFKKRIEAIPQSFKKN